MTTAYVALGATLGEAPATLRAALADINAVPGIRVVKTSSFYRTAPVDSSGPDYTNAVCEVETTLSADALLSALQTIENRHGRVRPAGVHNAPRTLDLDVLLYGDTVIHTSRLTVPHPRMHGRAVVLFPLWEIVYHGIILSTPGRTTQNNVLECFFKKDIFKKDKEARATNVKRLQQYVSAAEDRFSSPLDAACRLKYILEYIALNNDVTKRGHFA